MKPRARRAFRWLMTVAAYFALLSLRHAPLRAADPLIRFQELMAGANGDSRIQFITIVAEGAQATCWGPMASLDSELAHETTALEIQNSIAAISDRTH